MDYFCNRNGLRPNWRGFNLGEVIRVMYITSRCKKDRRKFRVKPLLLRGPKMHFSATIFLEKFWERREDLSWWVDGFLFQIEKGVSEGYEFLLGGIFHQEPQILIGHGCNISWVLEKNFLVIFQQQIDLGKRHFHPFSL